MEVKPDQSTIHRYWDTARKRSLIAMVAAQTAVFAVFMAGLLVFGIADAQDVRFWLLALAGLALFLMVGAWALLQLLDPLKQLAAALTQVNGERSSVAPPNPNLERYRKNGLKPLLQAVYELGTKADAKPADNQKEASGSSLLEDAALHANAGIAIFDEDGKLLYKNEAAPIRSNPEGGFSIGLLYYNEQPFDAWLKETTDRVVEADKTWRRLANKPAGEEGRKVYDMSASFQKGSRAPVMVVFFEKTDEYTPEDEDLNFIAFAAHELRGPITVIRGYLDSLNEELGPTLNGDQKQLIERLIVSANRLTSYINNILNASRYDRQHFTVRLQEASLANIYDTIADDMALRAASQQRLLSVDIPYELPTVAADPASLSEVLSNLIDNAIKYSSEGGSIEVRAHADKSFVEVEVEDHGIGMPSNVMSNLFQKFYRSHRSRETVAGSGIGLFICKAIVESHGGTMGVRSVEGKGSTFSFTVPIYATVADKLKAVGGDNRTLISNHSGSWIKNHGSMRG